MLFPFSSLCARAARSQVRRLSSRHASGPAFSRHGIKRRRSRLGTCPIESLEKREVLSVSLIGTPPDDPIVFETTGPLQLTGESGDYVEVAHSDSLSVSDGAVTLSFTTDNVEVRQALFSKDGSGFQNGGHLTAFVNDGRIEVRMQNTETSVYVKIDTLLEPNQQHHLAVTFGADGLWVYLDGRIEGYKTQFFQGLDTNTEPLAIGANIWARSEEKPQYASDFFQGTIDDFVIYGGQLDAVAVARIARASSGSSDVARAVDSVLAGDVSKVLSDFDIENGHEDADLGAVDL